MQIGSKPDGRLPKAPKGGGRVKQCGLGGSGIDRGREPYFHLPSFLLIPPEHLPLGAAIHKTNIY